MVEVASRVLDRLGYTVLRVPSDYGFHEPPGSSSVRARTKFEIRRLLRERGLVVRRSYPPDFDSELVDICERVAGYTTSSRERLAALYQAVKHISRHKVPGSIVETGVWRGGSMMAAALTLLSEAVDDRDFYLFDTFEGMPEPDDVDVGHSATARSLWRPQWLAAGEPQVRAVMASTGYPPGRIRLVKGLVEDTIPGSAPEQIALLRIDTDWYSSVAHALDHLYPRLEVGGILILDDYGAWTGAQKAVDEYFGTSVYLHRIDYSARLVVKCS